MPKVELVSSKNPAKVVRVPTNVARVLVRSGRFTYRTTALEPRASDGVGQAPIFEPDADEAGDEGVYFASPAARDAARAAGLTPSAFADRIGSGHDGSFTKADVLEIVEDWS